MSSMGPRKGHSFSNMRMERRDILVLFAMRLFHAQPRSPNALKYRAEKVASGAMVVQRVLSVAFE